MADLTLNILGWTLHLNVGKTQHDGEPYREGQADALIERAYGDPPPFGFRPPQEPCR